MADVINMSEHRKPPSKYDALWKLAADPKLSAAAKMVAVALLLNFRNDETGRCNPSMTSIAKVVGRGVRSVNEAVNELKSAGWIEISGTKGGAQTNTNSFVFPFLKSSSTGVVHDRGTGAVHDRGTPVVDDSGPLSCTADELSIELSKKDARARARPNANGNTPANAERSGEGSTQRCLVHPGTPAFGAWHAWFEQLNAQKMLKHLRECIANNRPATMTAPMPPSRARAPP